MEFDDIWQYGYKMGAGKCREHGVYPPWQHQLGAPEAEINEIGINGTSAVLCAKNKEEAF